MTIALSFDANYYLSARPDVFNAFVATAGSTGQTWVQFAQNHYNTFGRFEGSNPNSVFNTTAYLTANPDVAAAGVNPFQHFLSFGLTEGRAPNASVPGSTSFDSAAYLAANADLGAAGITTPAAAYAHFLEFGQFESRPGTPAVTTPGATFTLTTGVDTGALFTGTSGDDTFVAGDIAGASTWTVGDALVGGAGNDTLKVITANAIAIPVGATLSGIETLDITTSGAVAALNTSSFAGLTTLNTSGVGGAVVTAAATTAIAVTNADAAGGSQPITVNGGSTVAVTSTNNVGDIITVGGTTAAAGAVTVKSTGGTVNGDTQGAINVTGGTKVTIDQLAGNAAATGNDTNGGAITVAGNASTTEVTVNQSANAVGLTAAGGVAGKVGYTAGTVGITDANSGSATAAGTITTVSLNNSGAATVNSGALKTLNLAGTLTTVNAGTLGGLTTAANTALALNLMGATSTGAVTIDTDIKTLNVDASGTASSINSLVANGATAVNIAGDAKYASTAETLGAVTAITVTNTAGASLGSQLGNAVAFTGGAGADSVVLGATTKAIAMGAGDDTVTINALPGAGGTVAGGDGKDTLVANTNGSSTSANPAFSGFEVLRVAGGAAQGAHNANGFTELEVGSLFGNASFTNVAAGVGLTQLATMGNDLTVTLANATGLADTFALNLKSAAAIGAAGDTITLAGVETVNITSTDTNTTAHVNTVELVATSATAVTVSGNAGLVYVNADASIKSFDASGVTLGLVTDTGVTFTSTNVTVAEAVSIKGSNGIDVLSGSASALDTIDGGAGADTIIYTGGADMLTGGLGADTFDINGAGTKTAFATITDALSTDKIDFAGTAVGGAVGAAMGAKITLGGAATLDQYLDAAAAGAGNVNALLTWFQFGTDTYVVQDNSAGAPFVSGADVVVKLTGIIDLSTSVHAADVLTIA